MGDPWRALVIGRAPSGTYHRLVTTSTSLSNIAPLAAQPHPGASTSRFAPLATPQFDEWFWSELTAMAGEVAAAVGGTFRGLVLGGGYGRGEGGIVVRHGRERPYNDVDLFLFVEKPRAVATATIGAISARYHQRLGVAVDVSRPYRPSEISSWRPTLMWHELAARHVVLKGPATLVDHLCPPQVRETPPATEALHLLLNRGAGLLWAMRVARGCEPAPDEDFVRRNYYKCLLGCGDALLIAHRAYGRSFAARGETLRALPTVSLPASRAALFDGYAAARRFKLAPDTLDVAAPSVSGLMQAAALWAEALLTVESVRTGRPGSAGCRPGPLPAPANWWRRSCCRQARHGRSSRRSASCCLLTLGAPKNGRRKMAGEKWTVPRSIRSPRELAPRIRYSVNPC